MYSNPPKTEEIVEEFRASSLKLSTRATLQKLDAGF